MRGAGRGARGGGWARDSGHRNTAHLRGYRSLRDGIPGHLSFRLHFRGILFGHRCGLWHRCCWRLLGLGICGRWHRFLLRGCGQGSGPGVRRLRARRLLLLLAAATAAKPLQPPTFGRVELGLLLLTCRILLQRFLIVLLLLLLLGFALLPRRFSLEKLATQLGKIMLSLAFACLPHP